jgi:hypothetical protein
MEFKSKKTNGEGNLIPTYKILELRPHRGDDFLNQTRNFVPTKNQTLDDLW